MATLSIWDIKIKKRSINQVIKIPFQRMYSSVSITRYNYTYFKDDKYLVDNILHKFESIRHYHIVSYLKISRMLLLLHEWEEQREKKRKECVCVWERERESNRREKRTSMEERIRCNQAKGVSWYTLERISGKHGLLVYLILNR